MSNTIEGRDAFGFSPYLAAQRRAERETVRNPVRRKEDGDPHLRSTQTVTGYHIHGLDGGIGHVEDFVIDEESKSPWTRL